MLLFNPTRYLILSKNRFALSSIIREVFAPITVLHKMSFSYDISSNEILSKPKSSV